LAFRSLLLLKVLLIFEMLGKYIYFCWALMVVVVEVQTSLCTHLKEALNPHHLTDRPPSMLAILTTPRVAP